MTDQTPEASAVEALAEVFRAALIDQYAVVIPEMDPEWAAEIVIASDWLAEHTRRAQAQAWDEGERHESDYLATWGQFCPHRDCNPYREQGGEG